MAEGANSKTINKGLKKGKDDAKSKWGAYKDIMDEKEKIKAPNVSLWARYHFSL